MATHSSRRHSSGRASRTLKSDLIVVVVVVAIFAVGFAAWHVVDGMRQETEEVPAEEPAVEEEPLVPAPTLSPFATMFASGDIASIRLIGDSITAGFGTNGYADPDVAGYGTVVYDDGMGTVHYETTSYADSWANAFRAWANNHGIQNFVNAGVNGALMVGFAENPDAWIGEGADVIVVALGTNDAGYYGPAGYRAAAKTALEAAAQHSKLVVVLSPVSDLRPEDMLVEPAASLKDVLNELCDEGGYVFVDCSAAVSPEQFCDDGLHPNTEGSLAIWECLRTALSLAE